MQQSVKEAFPELTPSRLRVVVQEVVKRRNHVATVNRVFKQCRWGVACLQYEEAKRGLMALSASPDYPWLKAVPEQGQAYTVIIGRTPLRVQSEAPTVRP